MFTCTPLKYERRLGTQLFQIAATIGMATKYKVDWVLPTWSASSSFKNLAPQTTLPLHVDAVVTPESRDDLDHFLDDRHVVDLRGAFHSDRFFCHCVAKVRHYFEFSPRLLEDVKHQYARLLDTCCSCVVVDSRERPARNQTSDAQEFRQLSKDAASQVDPRTRFAVMSADPAWWDSLLGPDRVVHLPRNEVMKSFVLGTLCQDVIMTGSAFGWWIAWLNECDGQRLVITQSVVDCEPHWHHKERHE
jgi:hypothetical protein